jgi:hypothetical protein
MTEVPVGSSETTNDIETVPVELLTRLQAASYALPVEEALRDIADDVAGWGADGLPDAQIDARIVEWMDEHGFGYSTWKDELDKDEFGLLSQYPNLDPAKLWKVFGFEAWVKDCIRSLAFTDELIPFHAWSAGMWLEQPDGDPPLLIAIITPLSDPQLAARQLIEKHRKLFGDKATRSTRKDEVANARMLHRKRDGMSYTDIAIQNLRQQHPDIVSHAHRYRAEIKRERERVIKCIRAAEEPWKERLPDSSTDA